MKLEENEEKLLRSVALQNAQAVLLARERAERELRDSNERITNILESISDAFVVLDREWCFTYVNPQAEQIVRPLHKSRADLLGTNFWQGFSDLVGTPLETNFRRAVAEKVKVEFEIFYAPLNSWFHVRAYPGRDGLSVYFLDITIQKQATEAVRESAERLHAVFNQAAVGISVASLEGRFVETNQKCSDILGYSIEELRTLTLFDVTHPDDLETTRSNSRRLLAGELPDFSYEKRYLRKDGRIVWSLTTVTLLKDAAGKPQFVLGLIEDITSRKLAETASRYSEERFRAIVKATPECVKVVAPDGNLLAMNSAGCAMVEADREADVVGQSVYGLIAPEFRQNFIEFNQSVCQGNKGHIEFQLVGLKGTRRWMETLPPGRPCNSRSRVTFPPAKKPTKSCAAAKKNFAPWPIPFPNWRGWRIRKAIFFGTTRAGTNTPAAPWNRCKGGAGRRCTTPRCSPWCLKNGANRFGPELRSKWNSLCVAPMEYSAGS
jgi:PAS domain S-box-containing protein